jgi:hypothetical protein
MVGLRTLIATGAVGALLGISWLPATQWMVTGHIALLTGRAAPPAFGFPTAGPGLTAEDSAGPYLPFETGDDLVERRIRSLQAQSMLDPENPQWPAAICRYAANGVVRAPSDGRLWVNGNGPRLRFLQQALTSASNQGQAIQQRNAFFQMMAGVAKYSGGDLKGALIAMERAAEATDYQEYAIAEGVTGIRAIENKRGYRGERVRTLILASILFPHYATIRATQVGMLYELHGEERDRARAAFAVLGFRMMQRSETLIGIMVGRALIRYSVGLREGELALPTDLSQESKRVESSWEKAMDEMVLAVGLRQPQVRADLERVRVLRSEVSGRPRLQEAAVIDDSPLSSQETRVGPMAIVSLLAAPFLVLAMLVGSRFRRQDESGLTMPYVGLAAFTIAISLLEATEPLVPFAVLASILLISGTRTRLPQVRLPEFVLWLPGAVAFVCSAVAPALAIASLVFALSMVIGKLPSYSKAEGRMAFFLVLASCLGIGYLVLYGGLELARDPKGIGILAAAAFLAPGIMQRPARTALSVMMVCVCLYLAGVFLELRNDRMIRALNLQFAQESNAYRRMVGLASVPLTQLPEPHSLHPFSGSL